MVVVRGSSESAPLVRQGACLEEEPSVPSLTPLRPLHSADPTSQAHLLAFALALPAACSALSLVTSLVSSGLLLRPLAAVFLLLLLRLSLPFPPRLPWPSPPDYWFCTSLGWICHCCDKIMPKSSAGSPRLPLNLPSLQTQRQGFMNMLLASLGRLVWVFPLVGFLSTGGGCSPSTGWDRGSGRVQDPNPRPLQPLPSGAWEAATAGSRVCAMRRFLSETVIMGNYLTATQKLKPKQHREGRSHSSW